MDKINGYSAKEQLIFLSSFDSQPETAATLYLIGSETRLQVNIWDLPVKDEEKHIRNGTSFSVVFVKNGDRH